MNKIRVMSGGAELVGSPSDTVQEFLFLHAGGETRQVWRPIQDRLARAGLGSVAFDQRGHGESSGSRREDISVFANDVKRMLSVCAGTKVAVGASLGGLAALLALQDKNVQESLNGLVLVDVVPAPDPDRVRHFLATTAPHLAETFLVEDILRKGPMLAQAASKIEIPILLVRAGAKGPMSDDEVRSLRGLCPHLCVEQVDAAGHLIARDAPVLLADILLRFEQSERVRHRHVRCMTAAAE